MKVLKRKGFWRDRIIQMDAVSGFEGVPGVSNDISVGDILHLHSGRDPVSYEGLFMRDGSRPAASV